MKKYFCTLLLLAFVPIIANAQADKKMIEKAQNGDAEAMVLLGECYENGAGVPLDSALAFQWFKKAADLGNGDGCLSMTRYYLRGAAGVEIDTARYFAIRKEWADKDYPNGISALGSCYEYGLGVARDSVKALELYQLAQKKGSPWGYYAMGLNYLYGELGLDKDVKKGISYLEKAYKMGEHQALDPLTTYYYLNNDYKKARKWAEEGMKWGDPDCYAIYAIMLYYGNGGLTADPVKARQMMDHLVATRHNCPWPQRVAGNMYMFADSAEYVDSARAMQIWLDGTHMEPSLATNCQLAIGSYYNSTYQLEKAYPFYKTVADKAKYRGGNSEALFAMGYMSQFGTVGEVDMDQAIAYYQRGVDEYHSAPCAMALAEIYQAEEHLDMPLAVKYLRLADQYGDTTALESLGRIYASNGNNDQAQQCFQQLIDRKQTSGYYWMSMLYDAQGNTEKSNEYIFKGDKAGDRDCAEIIGTMYEFGYDGMKTDAKKAAKYYERSQSAKSLYRLGLLYLNGEVGKGKKADLDKGLNYVMQSAAMGNVDAIYSLGYCYETGAYVDSVDHEKAVQLFQLLADNDVPAGQFKMGLYYELGDGGIEADSVKAIEYYQKAADQGHGEAMCYLGDFYRLGRYMPLDSAKAFELYSKAHETGEEIGTYYVGRSYLEGCGVDIDTAMAIPYLKAAAYQGVGNAAYKVAEMYNYGLGGLPGDSDSAIFYYQLGHKGGSADASYFIGKELLNEGYTEQGVQYLYTGAKRGNVDAMVLFALCVQNGIGIEEDPETAHTIFGNIVRNYGDPRAYYQLGLAEVQGNGCPEDEALGKSHLDTAANLGNTAAMCSLAQCYLNGYGCRVDTTLAISWLEKSVDGENTKAINELGDVYEAMGDFKNAVLYYEKGVSLGSLESYCNLGYCYEQGQGVVLNSKKAYELYMFAAEHEYNRGYMCVANCYLNGIYVEENAAEALIWLQKAAENGNVVAMYYCGSILEEGADGLPADLKKAREWYKKAAAAGYDPAAAALSRMKR